jgi:hypothetical protein
MTQMAEGVETTHIEDMLPYEDDGKDRLAHYINPAMNGHIQNGVPMTAKEILFIARLNHLEVVALCGYRWVPNHNPDKYDLCQECSDIANQIISEDG